MCLPITLYCCTNMSRNISVVLDCFAAISINRAKLRLNYCRFYCIEPNL